MKKIFVCALLFAAMTVSGSEAVAREKKEKAPEAPVEENPIAEIKQTPGLTPIIRRWGFIGDSLCSGEMECYAPGAEKVSYKDMYEYSWGQYLCRLCGAEGTNYSHGGQTAMGWINEVNNTSWAACRLDPKQAYIVALGVNDYGRFRKGQLEKGDLKTDVNLEDYNQNAKTFAGYYAGVIQRVKSIQKDAKFFLVTMPRQSAEGDPARDEWNDIIRSAAEMFDNVYVIDLYKFGPVYDDAFCAQYKLNGHLSAAGYLYTAYMFCTYIDWIISHNAEDFKNIPLIGTTYSKYKNVQ